MLLLAAAGTWRLWPVDATVSERLPAGGYVDMHVHLAGLGNGCTACFVHPSLRQDLRFAFFLRAMGVTLKELEGRGDVLVVERLRRTLGASRSVSGAVLLALDGAVGDDGELDLDASQLYVPNEYVASQAALDERTFFGASVNPYRHDALQRLEQVAGQGAVLIKWIPAIQFIDPSDPAIEPFYRKMQELGLPLLSHAGKERSFPEVRDEFSDPQKLSLPLSLGLTVIAAHIGTTGRYERQPSYDRLLEMFGTYPNLYADISSLTQINKLGFLRHALDQPAIVERLIYGSDWPLQMFPLVHPLYHWPNVSVGQARGVAELPNVWDRDVALKQALGVPPEVFERTAVLLNLNPAGAGSADR